MSETYILTFNDEKSYKKCKEDVITSGGTIKNDLGSSLLGFTAVISPALVATIRSGNLKDNGITTFEPDSKVYTQRAV